MSPPHTGSSSSSLTHLTTNLRLLRFMHADHLVTLSLLTQPNHRATEAIMVFLFQHIDPGRARSTFRNLLAVTGTDLAARRTFRAAAFAWLDELKPMFPSPVLLRKSFLDDGRGERFVELLAALSFHALRCVLARTDARAANRVAEVAGPEGRVAGGVMEQHALAMVDAYRDELQRDVAVRQSCASLGKAYDARLKELDDEWEKVAKHLAADEDAVPQTSAIRAQLTSAHKGLGSQWARLASAVPWEPARDLVRLALDPSRVQPKLAIPSAASPSNLDWTQLAAAAARTLTECASATAPTPVDANAITQRAAQVAQLAEQAEARCVELQAQVDAANAQVDALRQAQPPLQNHHRSSFPIRLLPFPTLPIRPHAPEAIVAKATDVTGPSWTQPLVIPPSRIPHPTLAHHPAPPRPAPQTASTHARQAHKRRASAALLDHENMLPAATVTPKPRRTMGPPSTFPTHASNPPLVPSAAPAPFTPAQHSHLHASLVSTPTSTTCSSSFGHSRPPAIWTLSPIPRSAAAAAAAAATAGGPGFLSSPPPCSDPRPPPSVVDLACGTSRRVSFTFRPIQAADDLAWGPRRSKPNPPQQPTTRIAISPWQDTPKASRRSTDVHRRIVDQMLSDAHAPASATQHWVQPEEEKEEEERENIIGDDGKAAANVTWTTPGCPSDCFPSMRNGHAAGGHRLSGAELAQKWFTPPPPPPAALGARPDRGEASGGKWADMDVSFDLDAFVLEQEGKGRVASIGDEELPGRDGGRGGRDAGEEEDAGLDGNQGDDSLLMMLQS